MYVELDSIFVPACVSLCWWLCIPSFHFVCVLNDECVFLNPAHCEIETERELIASYFCTDNAYVVSLCLPCHCSLCFLFAVAWWFPFCVLHRSFAFLPFSQWIMIDSVIRRSSSRCCVLLRIFIPPSLPSRPPREMLLSSLLCLHLSSFSPRFLFCPLPDARTASPQMILRDLLLVILSCFL